MEAGKKMNMEQFAECIREKIEQQGRFEKVSIRNILKNNGVTCCGLLLHGGSNLVPTIYLEPFFEAYDNGAGMEEIVGKILESHESASREGVDMSFFREFSMVKERICMKLVNREANVTLLSEVPHREFLDMAVVYYVDYYNPEVGTGTIQIYHSHVQMWRVTEEDLWAAANINTPERRPGRIAGLEDVLAEMFTGQKRGDSECCTENSSMPMLVITNTKGVYGAAVLLYNKMLKRVADQIGSDLFILPSSLHEVIAIPVSEESEAIGYREMVLEVNRNVLKTEEVLSDNVYIYRREQDRLEIA